MLFGGYEPDPVARWVDGVPWDHGARALPPDHERFAQLMAGAVRRFPFLEDAGVVALVCHPDAMTPDGNPLLGPHAGHPRVLDGGRPLAERLRRRRRNRKDDRRVDDDRRDRARHERLPRLALRRRVPGARPGRGRRPRGLSSYYYRLRYPLDTDEWGRPNRLSPLHGRLQEAGRGVRREERLGARRPLRPGEALAALGRRPARVRLGAAAVVQARRRGARRDPRARRPHRHDLVRKDRGPGPRRAARCSNASPATGSTAPGERRLHAVSERRRRDRRRRDRDAARRGPVPRRDRRGRRRLRPRLAAGATSSPRTARSRCATRAPSWPSSACGARRRATVLAGRHRGRRLGRGVPVSHGVAVCTWPEPT